MSEQKPPSGLVGIQRNAARCRSCGDEIESTHRHDFRSCSCGDLSVDGGKAYIKRGYRSGTTWDELTVCHHRPNPYMPERCEFCGEELTSSAPSTGDVPADATRGEQVAAICRCPTSEGAVFHRDTCPRYLTPSAPPRERPASVLYETCRYDGNPFPCGVHVGCFAAGFERCQDVRVTVTEDDNGRSSATRCHRCGEGYGAMYVPREWYDPTYGAHSGDES